MSNQLKTSCISGSEWFQMEVIVALKQSNHQLTLGGLAGDSMVLVGLVVFTCFVCMCVRTQPN